MRRLLVWRGLSAQEKEKHYFCCFEKLWTDNTVNNWNTWDAPRRDILTIHQRLPSMNWSQVATRMIFYGPQTELLRKKVLYISSPVNQRVCPWSVSSLQPPVLARHAQLCEAWIRQVPYEKEGASETAQKVSRAWRRSYKKSSHTFKPWVL